MKKNLLLVFGFSMLFSYASLQAQCTPGDSLSCPDPEGNGEICPDTFPQAVVNVPFSVEFTILPPPQVVYQGFPVPIHHITLVSVDNLPPGITFQSNEPTGVFYPATYYCVLLSGTPTTAGTFPLKIKVDAYVNFLGNPVFVGQQTDSTSLAITVAGSAGTDDLNPSWQLQGPWPNPFSESTSIVVGHDQEDIYLRISDITGKTLYSELLPASAGERSFRFSGEDLLPGVYFY
ncbi:MAG: T9SS type A sorting domain-containing protein, partial [Bacteroidales bacterium]|nr:T9SS type A sorting domain-containing protein [Bacteroidales bacterium]